MPPASTFKRPAYHIWFLGPEGSGKTTAALSFPRICTMEFDPTGLDVMYDPSSRASEFADNVVYRMPMSGIEAKELFAYTEQPSERSVYGAIAMAIDLRRKGQIDTLFLDGYTYLSDAKWNHIFNDEDEQVRTRSGAMDTQKMYGRLSSWLAQFTLGTLAPLATRYNMNVIVTAHIQRESKNTVEGMDENSRDPNTQAAARAVKRLVNLDSDMAPQIVGGFRQKIGGLPSAMIYLDHWMENVPNPDKKKVETIPTVEVERHVAYCRQVRVERWDTVVKAKNRYGMPASVNITDKSFYRLLLGKLKEAEQEKAKRIEEAKKAAVATTAVTAPTGGTIPNPPPSPMPVVVASGRVNALPVDPGIKGKEEPKGVKETPKAEPKAMK